MRCIVIGLGIQGAKRQRVAGSDCVATVDPVRQEAIYRDLEAVPLDSYEAALVCTPDGAKPDLLRRLLESGKHVLVEKPLITEEPAVLEDLATLASRMGRTLYTAYNHRFEPHFQAMKRLLESGRLGRIYRCRMFYGNGTARDVRNSAWRDKGPGVLPDLGSHLLDTVLFWFGETQGNFRILSANRYENRSFDHVVIGVDGLPGVELEMTLLSWRNHFTCDIFAENGSAHIESLCKWGPSTFTVRSRKLPSGRPDEETSVLVQADPTWAAEYTHFLELCRDAGTNVANDLWINRQLSLLAQEASSR
ncbi:Gfo/Idh/MocA family oxidoreductase [Azospirillum sp. BE72]|uniref:Gfo/Idh/MocA family protein n=1 Tax=Azospirillum sp. BE72 TaxID=2817776 RepID=UPI002860BEB4|nr:Gfo/Idh/MocA family oxidoreductase [Azospirillum sp. BE72]MDR6774202.1 putative dehydrogenase [Azospirillum sp. BE72]